MLQPTTLWHTAVATGYIKRFGITPKIKFINCAWVKCKYLAASLNACHGFRVHFVLNSTFSAFPMSCRVSFYTDLAGDYRNYNPRAIRYTNNWVYALSGACCTELKALCISDCCQLINMRVLAVSRISARIESYLFDGSALKLNGLWTKCCCKLLS